MGHVSEVSLCFAAWQEPEPVDTPRRGAMRLGVGWLPSRTKLARVLRAPRLDACYNLRVVRWGGVTAQQETGKNWTLV